MQGDTVKKNKTLNYVIEALKKSNIQYYAEMEKVISDFLGNIEIDFSGANKCESKIGTDVIVIGDKRIDWNDYGTLFHEIGHKLFEKKCGRILVDQSEKYVDQNEFLKCTQNYVAFNLQKNNTLQMQLDIAKKMYEEYNEIKKREEMNIKTLANEADDVEELYDIRKDYIRAGLDIKIKKKEKKNWTQKEMLEYYSRVLSFDAADKYIIDYYSDEICFIDMIAAVFKSNLSQIIMTDKESEKEYRNIFETFAHSESYFDQDDVLRIDEIFANYVQLKMSENCDNNMERLRELFGKTFVDTLESTFNYCLNIKKIYKSI